MIGNGRSHVLGGGRQRVARTAVGAGIRRAPVAIALAAVSVAALGGATARSAPAQPPPPGPSPRALLEAVPRDPLHVRYTAKDTGRRQLAGLDVVADPIGTGYIGVYFWPSGPGPADYAVSVGVSPDLINWRRVTDLDVDGGNMPTIRSLPGGGFLVAYEDYTALDGETAKSQIRVRYYPGREQLLRNRWAVEQLLPRTLSPSNEGTPSIEDVAWSGRPETSVLRIGFHYNAGARGVDRQAEGMLRGFRDWRTVADPATARRLRAAGFLASHGKRSHLDVAGRRWDVVEAQRLPGSFGAWSLALEDTATGTTQGLSLQGWFGPLTSVGVPTVKVLPGPLRLGRVLFVSAYVFSGRLVGPLVYYRPLPPGW